MENIVTHKWCMTYSCFTNLKMGLRNLANFILRFYKMMSYNFGNGSQELKCLEMMFYTFGNGSQKLKCLEMMFYNFGNGSQKIKCLEMMFYDFGNGSQELSLHQKLPTPKQLYFYILWIGCMIIFWFIDKLFILNVTRLRFVAVDICCTTDWDFQWFFLRCQLCGQSSNICSSSLRIQTGYKSA